MYDQKVDNFTFKEKNDLAWIVKMIMTLIIR